VSKRNCTSAYIVGAALGDGNLSNPNGRATRLRITCDSTYPGIAEEIIHSLQTLFPDNKVSVISHTPTTYFNISVYSNQLDELLPWRVGCGTKFEQNAHVPDWIKADKDFSICCLRGLLHTDGSIYLDRGYTMVNFTNNTVALAQDVLELMESLGYKPKFYKAAQKSIYPKYTVRLSRDVDKFLREINLQKS
jgi:DNA-binding transcriptional regulator WhiA